MFRGKKYKESAQLVDRTNLYDPSEAMDLVVKTAKAKADLGFVAQKGIDEMCRDAWNWQKNNPNGFDK